MSAPINKKSDKLLVPIGVQLRRGKNTESIGMSFYFESQEYRETVKLPINQKNINYVAGRRAEILHKIAYGKFVYEEYFPNSLKSRTAAKARLDAEAQKVVETVGQILRDYLVIAKKNLALSSFNQYSAVSKKHLFPRWENKPMVELGTKEIRVWIAEFTCKSKTIASIVLPLRNAIELAIADGVIDKNPFDPIKLGKILSQDQCDSEHEVNPCDVNEIEAILKACEHPQERNMIAFAIGTGARMSEYIALDWKDVNFKNNTVRISSSHVDGVTKQRGKTIASIRDIELRKISLEALQAQYKITGATSGLVFLHPLNGVQWTGDKQIRDRWCRILKIAEVQYRNPYQTRHTYASSLMMLGKNPMYVAMQMGHVDTTMITNTYGKWKVGGLDGDKEARLEALYADFTQKSKTK